MSKPTNLRDLRAKAEMFDELVERLAVVEDELERQRENVTSGLDLVWREIANDLAAALRPYTLFGEQRVRDGRIVVETAVPGSTLTRAREALERLGRHVAVESYRRHGIPLAKDTGREAGERAA